MSHHDHRAPELAAEARERFEHDLLVALVEFGGRFVGEDERRLARGRGGDRHPLLLPAGEGACARSLSPAQVEGVERVGNSVIDPPAAGKPQRERHVLAYRQSRPQIAALEHDRRFAGPEGCQLGLVEVRQRTAEDANVSCGRLVEPGGQMQHRALPRAGRPEHGDELAGFDPQLQTAQRNRLHGTGAENLEHVVELERAERQLLAPLGLAPEACYRHRKLSIINRYASTLSTPSGVPRSTIASLPACER